MATTKGKTITKHGGRYRRTITTPNSETNAYKYGKTCRAVKGSRRVKNARSLKRCY